LLRREYAALVQGVVRYVMMHPGVPHAAASIWTFNFLFTFGSGKSGRGREYTCVL